MNRKEIYRKKGKESKNEEPKEESKEEPDAPKQDASDSVMQIEENTEPRSFKDKQEEDKKVKYARQKKYLAEHKDVNVRNATISKIRTYLLQYNLAADFKSADSLAKDLFAQGITHKADVLLYVHKQSAATQEPKKEA